MACAYAASDVQQSSSLYSLRLTCPWLADGLDCPEVSVSSTVNYALIRILVLSLLTGARHSQCIGHRRKIMFPNKTLKQMRSTPPDRGILGMLYLDLPAHRTSNPPHDVCVHSRQG